MPQPASGPGRALSQALLQANAPAGLPLAQLARLQLSMEQLASAAGLESYCPALQSLALESNQLRGLEGMRGLSQLQELSLRGNQLSSMLPLAALSRLRRLALDHNCVTSVEGLAGSRQLQQLTLSSNGITSLAAAALEGCRATLQVGAARVAGVIAPAHGLHAPAATGMPQQPTEAGVPACCRCLTCQATA
jgi:Leucine-rich repeat (LRR) protein